MLKYCIQQWDKNYWILKKKLEEQTGHLEYRDLVRLVVENIFNRENVARRDWDIEKIVEIDHGDYQGTCLYLIPSKTYQPGSSDYLMTYVYYGSCSACDTLEGITSGHRWVDGSLTATQVDQLLMLCKDIIQNTIKPYNNGWRHDELFDHVESNSSEDDSDEYERDVYDE